MTAFADSSALVKLYADEPGANAVRDQPLLVVSALARVEVPAALWRKSRTKELSVEHAAFLTSVFEGSWYDEGGPFVVVAIGGAVLDLAAQLTATRSLRAYDGVQLATALTARAADAGIDTFLTADRGLGRAAAHERFSVPTLH